MQTIYRVLSENNLNQFISDFENLIKIVNNSKGELDLSIRNDYLNLYIKGNSLTKIEFNKDQSYKISVHKKFFEGTRADSEEFYASKSYSGEYALLTLNADKSPLRFLQKAHINQLSGKVKKVNYGEEIVFVLEGQVEVRLSDHADILNQGDSIYYDSTLPHVVSCYGDGPATILAVIYAKKEMIIM